MKLSEISEIFNESLKGVTLRHIKEARFKASCQSLALELVSAKGDIELDDHLVSQFRAIFGEVVNLELPLDARSKCMAFSLYNKRERDNDTEGYSQGKNEVKTEVKFYLTRDGLITLLNYAGYEVFISLYYKGDECSFVSNGFNYELRLSSKIDVNRDTGNNEWVKLNLICIFVGIENKSSGYRFIIPAEMSMIKKINNEARKLNVWNKWFLQMAIKAAMKYAINRASIPEIESNEYLRRAIMRDDIADIADTDERKERLQQLGYVDNYGSHEHESEVKESDKLKAARADFVDKDGKSYAASIMPPSDLIEFMVQFNANMNKYHDQVVAVFFDDYLSKVDTTVVYLDQLNLLLDVYKSRREAFDKAIAVNMFRRLTLVANKVGVVLDKERKVFINTTEFPTSDKGDDSGNVA